MSAKDTEQIGTVLVVDDDAAIRALFRRSLSNAGYTVLLAEDYRQAYRHFDDLSAIDAVLLDVILPELNGLICSSAQRTSDHPPRSW